MAFLGEDIPKLGFGLMRLPEFIEGDKKTIDIEQLKQMVDAFMDAGFTYFDTAWAYHGGRSEVAIREALVERYPRESFQLATKLPAWLAKDAEAAKAMLETSLERTGAGYFDYYLLHNMGESRTQAFDKFGIWDYVVRKKEERVIKHLGFSIHDHADVLEKIATEHPELEFVQIQFNYADWENPLIEARKCYETARRLELPIIVMEPVKGGTLTRLPETIAAPFKEADPSASLASWALRFAASAEGVITVLSGMSTLEQVQENVAIMKDFKPLSPDEQLVVEKVRHAIEAVPDIPCTDCRYCTEVCPQDIHIPTILSQINIALRYDDLVKAREGYAWIPQKNRASQCIACGDCEEACPQHIEIVQEMEHAADLFE